jgi:hypothetical protein
VLFASSSFMIGIHRCGKIIQNVALLTKAESCGMNMQSTEDHQHEANTCCQDETIVHDAQDFKNTINQVNLSATQFVYVDTPPIIIAEVIPASNASDVYYNYDPPLPTCDLTVSLHVFLI